MKTHAKSFNMSVLPALIVTIVTIVTISSIIGLASEPQHGVGSGSDDWWINYPTGHEYAGYKVVHPSWVQDALKTGPILIYGHIVCPYCPTQEGYIKNALSEHGDSINYMDIWLDGRDERYLDMIKYDPDGGSNTVPLTVFITLVREEDSNGKPTGPVAIGWHSSGTLTDQAWVNSYTEDAIYYYQQNSANWAGN